MSLSYYTESEAPRDFRVSSTESDGHYTKCLLCYTVKRNFYCPECIRAGNFVYSSMPYADRYSEKQAKLLRLKANRRHVLDRCEKLLSPKIKRDTLLTEVKQARDNIDLLRLAIEQKRSNVEEKRKELNEIKQHNNELSLKLPRYEKRVSSLGKHAASQRNELANKVTTYQEKAAILAALRRSRVRQLIKYIFPVYMTYDTSDSIEDLEFLGEEMEEPPKRGQMHILTPWIYVDGDYEHVSDDMNTVKEGGGCSSEAARVSAALGLGGQLTALLADTLDCPLPYTLTLSEYYTWSGGRAARARARRLGACAAALCARSQILPHPHPAPQGSPGPAAPQGPPGPAALHVLCQHAARDTSTLGRVESWLSDWILSHWPDSTPEDGTDLTPHDVEPEHLHWPEHHEMDELSSSPASPPPASLVTSAAASIASIWRGWTK